MKTNLLLSLFLCFGQLATAADNNISFETTRNGVNYRCEPSEQDSNPKEISKCLSQLKFKYSDELISIICRKASSDAPVKCANELKFKFDDNVVAHLCSGAQNEFSAQCANELKFRFSDELVAKICRRAKSDANAKCAIEQKFRIPDEQVAVACGS
jgi:hypothetical protein